MFPVYDPRVLGVNFIPNSYTISFFTRKMILKSLIYFDQRVVLFVLRSCTTKKPAICHVHLATCTDIVHVANRWPRVLRVLDPGVAKCTFGRVYSNTRVQLDMCIVIHVSDCLPRVLEYKWQSGFPFFNYIFYLNIIV
jgi:hypothetical protein